MKLSPPFTLVSLLAVGSASASIVITDPGFDAALVASDAGVTSSETGTWQRNGAAGAAQSWTRTTSIIGVSGVLEGIAKYNDGTQNGSDSRALVQVITGTGSHTGLQTLSFNYLLNDAPSAIDHTLKLRVEVFGIPSGSWTSGAIDLAMANTDAYVASEDDVSPGPLAVLLNSTAFTETTDATISASTWQTATFNLNLAGGYDRIAIRFTASDGSPGGTLANTTIAVDNIAIVPEPGTALLALASLGLLGIRRR